MEQFALTARLRDEKGTSAARQCRREGFIPGVVYGHGKAPSNIAVAHKEFAVLLRHHGASHVIDLTIEGQVKDADAGVVLKEMQRDPVTREVLSLDFQWISMSEKVEMTVPVTLVGEAPGVKSEGGALEQVMHEILVSCLPGNLPEAITVDISGLSLGTSLHVSDVQAPEGVEILADAEATIVTIAKPISEADLESRPLEEGEEVEGLGTTEEETEA